jgi:uncharacterized protein YbjQ (UPF0145 family)
MIVTTTERVEGRRVQNYLGLVSGEAIIGANIAADILAGLRDIVGGRSATYEDKMGEAREMAVAEMAMVAKQMGANAVIGVSLDYETVGKGTMLMVAAYGTAVVLEDEGT